MTTPRLMALPHAVRLPCNAVPRHIFVGRAHRAVLFMSVQGSLCCAIAGFSAGGCRATLLPTLTDGSTSEPESCLSF